MMIYHKQYENLNSTMPRLLEVHVELVRVSVHPRDAADGLGFVRKKRQNHVDYYPWISMV